MIFDRVLAGQDRRPRAQAPMSSFRDQIPSGGVFEPIIARIQALQPPVVDASLERIERLLRWMGDPQNRLPPTFHVAGTNGKGSTCAYLRSIAEAAGLRAHVYTSPHLIRFNERVRVAGAIVSDVILAEAILHAERANDGAPITIFEIVTAAALQLFASYPSDICVLEVGLGGRADATNVVRRPAVCSITSISMDHSDVLGGTIREIAREKAGIMKPGAPVVVGRQSPEATRVIASNADDVGARLLQRDRDWTIERRHGAVEFADAMGQLSLPLPSLDGAHQLDNAGIAITSLRASELSFPGSAFDGIAAAKWPGRMQRLKGGLSDLLPPGWELWLDGGHNVGAAEALATHFADWRDVPIHLIVGMKDSKDAAGFLNLVLPFASSCWAVADSRGSPRPTHDCTYGRGERSRCAARSS